MKMTVVIVVGASFIPFAFAQNRFPSAPSVVVCDLLKQPGAYKGSVIALRAHISGSEEGSVIFDQHCSGSILFALGADAGSDSRKLTRLLKSHSSVDAKLVGTFEHAATRTFGHQSAWDSRFTAQSVSEVNADQLGWLVGTAAIFGETGFVGKAASP